MTNTDDSDCHGIQADGIAADSTIYRLFSWEQRSTPQDVLARAILKAIELGAQIVGVETDQGGDTWQSVYTEAWRKLKSVADAAWGLRDDAEQTDDAAEQSALLAQAAQLAQTVPGILPRGAEMPAFRSAKAGAGHGSKIERQSRQLADYERGRFVHVEGTHMVLEKALRRFPKAKPYDLADASYWSWHWLAGGGMSNSAVGAFG